MLKSNFILVEPLVRIPCYKTAPVCTPLSAPASNLVKWMIIITAVCTLLLAPADYVSKWDDIQHNVH